MALRILRLVVFVLAIGLAADFSCRILLAEDTVASLKEKERKIQETVKRVMPATVSVTDRNEDSQRGEISSGSGVIVSEDGIILTAAHVILSNAESFEITFADGRVARAKPLGKNLDVDAGMLKIEGDAKWPHVELADLSKFQRGDWCVALGYPGGYELGRTPPVRVGRILANAKTVLMSDCALNGGDSGGPLFNLDGELLGIHSSIGASIDQNRHVPVTLYKNDWDKLLKGESWGTLGRLVNINPNRPMLGIRLDFNSENARIESVFAKSPAEKAGLKSDDVILKVDGEAVDRSVDVIEILSQKKPGTEISLEVEREGKTQVIKAKLARSSDLEQ